MKGIVALVFTQGVSVEEWHRLGLLDRERQPYERLVRDGGATRVLWFTYGARDKRYEEGLDGIEIVPMPRFFDSKVGRLAYSLALPWVRARELNRADVIKTNQMKGSWTGVLAAKRLSKRLVVRTGFTWSLFRRRTPMDWLAPLAESLACRAADEIHVTTESQRVYLLRSYDLHPDRVRVVPNFVDVERFRPDPQAAKAARTVFVGRLAPQKNLASLVRALAGTGLGLDLFGDGPDRESLAELARCMAVDVAFHGRTPNSELPAALNARELFVLPSLYEGFPKALLEAMACGMAVVAADSPGNRDLVEHGRTGWLAPPTPEGLRAAIEFLRDRPEIRARLGAAAAAEVRRRYSLEEVMRLEAHAR